MSSQPKTKGLEEPTMASQADRYALYEISVQDASFEVSFLETAFLEIAKRPALTLREDFCSTALLAATWVRQSKDHSAVGIDIEKEPLDWCRLNRLPNLSPSERSRLTLMEGDVLTAESPKSDIVMAGNFSYWCFLDRKTLRNYFVNARKNLAEDGLFVMDSFGGAGALEETTETKRLKGFTYQWEQISYEPIGNRLQSAIHFKFPDKSQLRSAFTYDWRLWSICEVRELLEEAGFSESFVYWEGEDEDGESNGEYSQVSQGSNDNVWIAYIVGKR